MFDFNSINSQFKLNDTVFYPFKHDVVIATVTEVCFHLGRDEPFSYGLITKEGKSYTSFEKELYSSHSEALVSLKSIFAADLEHASSRSGRYELLLDQINKVISDSKCVGSSKKYTLTRVLGHDIKVFQENEVVFVAKDIRYYDPDDGFVFSGKVEEVMGHISTSGTFISYYVEDETYMNGSRYSMDSLFYSESEALLFVKQEIESILEHFKIKSTLLTKKLDTAQKWADVLPTK